MCPSSSSSASGGPGSGPGVGGDLKGQVSSELMASMRAKIIDALEDTVSCEVVDESGDGQHVNISVVSKAFEDKSAVNRQRMVYKAIWMELQEAVHAVDNMSCKTPKEAGLSE